MAAALPSLSQIPEEQSLDGSRLGSSLALRPRSIAGSSLSSESSAISNRPAVSRGSSFESGRVAPNFSRPRTASPAGSYRSLPPPLPDLKADRNYILDASPRRTPYGVPFYPEYDVDLDDIDKDTAPAPVVLKDRRQVPRAQTWLYKPSTRPVHDSDASSVVSDTDTDAESTAESTGTGYASSISDFAYDLHNGWQSRRAMDPAARERQRWAAPMIQTLAQRASSVDRPAARAWAPPARAKSDSARSEKARQLANNQKPVHETLPPLPNLSASRPQRTKDDASWLDSGSEGTPRASRPAMPDTPNRRSHVDVVEAASAHRYGTRPGLGRATTAPGLTTARTPTSRRRTETGTPRRVGQERPQSHVSPSPGDGWKASEVDISGLSPAKIAKLEKKGVNPALYLEMKKARKMGRRGIAMLNPNSFIG